MKIKIDNGGRTLPNEDADCWLRSFSRLLDIPYGEAWKMAASKYGRHIGEPVKWRMGSRCGKDSDFSEFGSLFRWKPLPHRPTLGELELGTGKFLLDICCADSWGGHHLVAAIDGTVFDNEEEAVGLEDARIVGYWKLDSEAAGILASGAMDRSRKGNLVAYPTHFAVGVTGLG